MKKPLRILSFDPGITKMGIVVLDVTFDPLHVTEVYRETWDGSKAYRRNKPLHDLFESSYCKLDIMELDVQDLYDEYHPDEVVSEGAFAAQYPATIISLTLIIGLLRRATHRNLKKDIHIVAPTASKKAFTQGGGAGKPDMRKAYDTCAYLTRLAGTASEHEIDATAHGIAYVLRDILHIYVEEPKKKKKKKK